MNSVQILLITIICYTEENEQRKCTVLALVVLETAVTCGKPFRDPVGTDLSYLMFRAIECDHTGKNTMRRTDTVYKQK